MRYQMFSYGNFPLLEIKSIGFSSNPNTTKFGPGKRDEFIIHYILKGEGFFNNQKLHAGQGFLITPELEEEYYYPDSDNPWEFVWIISVDPTIRKIFDFLSSDSSVFEYNFPDKLNDIKQHLITCKNQITTPIEMLKMFLSIFKHHFDTKHTNKTKSNSQIYIDAAMNYISANYALHLSVSELCEILGVSQPYLFKIFKKSFGKSPQQFITEYRLSRAKLLLSESNLSITQIANSVGFGDVLSFSKTFSAKENCSPSEYRKKSQ